MTHFYDREYFKSPDVADWLNDFFEQQIKEATSADIFKKKNDLDDVEAMVQELRKRVGLDLISDNVKIASNSDILQGGLGDGREDSDFLQDQLEKGIEVEKEHTFDVAIRKEIAKDHLTENERYYDYLEEMEEKMDKESKASFLNKLVDIANAWEEIGNIKLAKKIDNLIFKISQDLEEEDILKKYPKLEDFIKKTVSSRFGFIDTPALMEKVLKILEEIAPSLKLKDKDKDKINSFIKKIKEDSSKLNKEDIFNESSLVISINDVNNNEDLFAKN